MILQLDLELWDTENRALDAGGQKSAENRNPSERVTQTVSGEDLDRLLAMAQRSRGWIFRERSPAFVTLDGGCRLAVIPARLWLPKVGKRLTDKPKLVPLPVSKPKDAA